MSSPLSCITDKPIQNSSDDQLKMARYTGVLSKFIEISDTPLTVGLQGEWGTGKTSMMYMLLEEFQQKKIATSWVNTWEYSMFRSSNETTPAILRGMLNNLRQNCINEGHWTLSDKTTASIKKIYSFLGNVANQVINNQVGLDLKSAGSGNETERVYAEIAEVKKEISEIINDLIKDTKNDYKKVVFFVDDLDRIPPAEAVEVLESLKNLFDVPHCVFVLAIDYDVVVKGLESKFGKKTEENEREFRSFFDKIIQVPFSMPTGTYDMGTLLSNKLSSLQINVPTNTLQAYSEIVKHTIGYNPRSLKRYINSFSLLKSIRDEDYKITPEEFDQAPNADDDLILFALIGIQISYPKIFRLLTQDPDYANWDAAFANKKNIDISNIKLEIEKFGDNDKLDEEWEHIIYASCQTDVYLKSKTFSILELLNYIRNHFSNDTELIQEKINTALRFASITTVDDDLSSKNAIEKRGKKTVFNDFNSKVNLIKEELLSQGANKQKLDIKLESYKKAYEVFEEISKKLNWNISIVGSYIKFEKENVPVAFLNNPPKSTDLIQIWINHSNSTESLPKGLILEKVKEDGFVNYKISAELTKAAFQNFIEKIL
jgi:hypothetical protein